MKCKDFLKIQMKAINKLLRIKIKSLLSTKAKKIHLRSHKKIKRLLSEKNIHLGNIIQGPRKTNSETY